MKTMKMPSIKDDAREAEGEIKEGKQKIAADDASCSRLDSLHIVDDKS